MNAQQFDQLIKRVNLEEDISIKTELITLIDKYLEKIEGLSEIPEGSKYVSVNDILNQGGETKEEYDNITIPVADKSSKNIDKEDDADITVSNKKTDLPVPVTKEPVEEVKVEPVDPNKHSAPSVKVNKDEVEDSVDPIIEEEPIAIDTTEESLVDDALDTVDSDTAEPVEDVKPEIVQVPVKEEKVTVTEDNKDEVAQTARKYNDTFVEEFGLPVTTEDHHLDEIIVKGGVMFREKRSFYLMLALEDEIIALGRTQKLEEFPDDIQTHLNDGGFINIDVLSYEDVRSTSKRRYINVSFTNLHTLENESWIVKSVNALLEEGTLPDRIKKDIDDETSEGNLESPIQDAADEVDITAEETPSEVEAEPSTTTELESEQKNGTLELMIHPQYQKIFKEQKEEVLSKEYFLVYQDGIGRLVGAGPEGKNIILAITSKTDIENNSKNVKLSDYQITELDNRHFIDVSFEIKAVKETEPESLDVAEPESGSEPQFPLVNELTLKMCPDAIPMLDSAGLKRIVGAYAPMLTTYDEDTKIGSISLAHNASLMASSLNELSDSPMKDEKWIIRVTSANFKVDGDDKYIILTFDQLEEVKIFPYEDKENNTEPSDFTIFKANPLQVETTNPGGGSSLIEKEYDASLEVQADLKEHQIDAQKELVSNHMVGNEDSVAEMNAQISVPSESQNEEMQSVSNGISNAIEQASADTGINTITEKKENTTEFMGNLEPESETSVKFVTGYSPASWQKIVGKRVHISSELSMNDGVTTKILSILGKEDKVIAKGRVPITNSLFLDGDRHEVEIIGFTDSIQGERSYQVTLTLGNFVKIA